MTDGSRLKKNQWKSNMRGGKRTNAGRKIGSPNKSTKDIQALAQRFGKDAIAALAKIMRESESDAARIAAAKELLDRGYGKTNQLVQQNIGPTWLELIHRSMQQPEAPQ